MKVCNLFFFLPVARIKIEKVIAAFSVKCHAIPALKISAEFSLCCQVSSREKGFKNPNLTISNSSNPMFLEMTTVMTNPSAKPRLVFLNNKI